MGVTFKIDHEKHLVHAVGQGVVVLDDILAFFDAMVIQDAVGYPKLFDAREMLPRLSDDDFMVLAARVSAYAVFNPRGAIAAVATTHEAVLALRRYANFLGDHDPPFRFFGSIDDARGWLMSLPVP